MSNRLDWIQQELDTLKQSGLYNRIRTLSSPQGAWLVVDNKKVLNFCSNNYLGLANHPRMVQLLKKRWLLWIGPGACALCRTMDIHLDGTAPGKISKG